MASISTMRSLASAHSRLRLLSLQQKRFQSSKIASVILDDEPQSQKSVEQETGPEQPVTDLAVQESSDEVYDQNFQVSSLFEELTRTTKAEFEQVIQSQPNPTLQREELVLSKFQKLLKTHMERDQHRKQFSSSSSLLSQFTHLIPTGKTEPYSEAELSIRQKQHEKQSGKLGSYLYNVYKPHELITNPPRPAEMTVQKLMAAGAHLGHSTKLWKHSTQQYIYGEYKDIHIIDLDQTINHLKRAASVVTGVVENGGSVLFLGLKQGQLRSVQMAAKRCNGYYVSHKWVPGTITNSVDNPRPRKEVDMGDVETGRSLTEGEETMVVKPDLMVILNPLEAKVAISEANQARIPTIGIVDTNCYPGLVTYGIPANDDSIRATNLICGVLARAGEAGLNKRLEKVAAYKKSLGLEPKDPLGEDGGEADDLA